MYYVSAMSHSGDRQAILLGPFRTHGAAESRVAEVHRWALEHCRADAVWARFGTCRRKTEHPPGRFNDELGYDGPGTLP